MSPGPAPSPPPPPRLAPTTPQPRPRARPLLALLIPASSQTFRTPQSPTPRLPKSKLLLPPRPRSFHLRPSLSPQPRRLARKPLPPVSLISIPVSALPSIRPPPLFQRVRIFNSSPPSPTIPLQTTSLGRSPRNLSPPQNLWPISSLAALLAAASVALVFTQRPPPSR